jgi:hypothetical protein
MSANFVGTILKQEGIKVLNFENGDDLVDGEIQLENNYHLQVSDRKNNGYIILNENLENGKIRCAGKVSYSKRGIKTILNQLKKAGF